MKNTFIISALLLFLCIGNAYGQRGKEFWFAAPKITTGDGGANDKARFVFTAYDQVTTIHIEQVQVPGFTPINITHTLQPNTSWEWNAGATYLGQLEVMANYPQPYALHMTADADFSCYFANITRNSEVYTLKGANALGKDFVVPMQYEYKSGSYADGFNSIQILATEDSTKIDVELFKRTTNSLQTSDHQTITIYLDRGFAYAFHSLLEDDCPGIDHLYNTRIKSNKPIAVNSTDDSVDPGDLLGDQLVPISLCGTSYIAIKNTGNIEKVYIFPTENGTVVTIDGVAQPVMNLPVNNLTANNSQMKYTLTSPATYISANKPIMVWQIATDGNEIGGGMLPKLECTGSMETAYRRAGGAAFFFNIITATEHTDAFTVNGVPNIITASDFFPVPGHSEYSYCRKNMAPSSTANGIRLKNSEGYFHVAAYDTPGASCTYGYFSDYHDIRLNVAQTLPNYTPGDVIHLWMTNADAFTNIKWTKPDGTVVYQDEINITNPTATDAGFYVVTATSKDGCIIEEDGVVVVNFVLPSSSSQTICQSESAELTAAGYAPYAWLPTAQTTKTISVTPANTTIYRVKNSKIAANIVYNGDFQEKDKPQPYMFESDYSYGGTSTTAVTTTEKYSVWRNAREVNAAYNRINDHTSTVNSAINPTTDGRYLIANCSATKGKKIWKRKVDVIPNTQYELAAWFVGALRGAAPAKLQFSVNNQVVGNVITTTDPGSTPTSTTWRQSSATWTNTTGVTAIISIEVADGSPASAGVCIDDITFRPLLTITDSFTVVVVPKPQPVISGDRELCRGSATLDAGADTNGNNFASYSWYKQNAPANILGTNRNLNVTSAGTYIVKVNNGSCENADTTTITAGENLNVQLGENQFEICVSEQFYIPYTIVEGNPQTFDLIFDARGHDAGLSDLLNKPLTSNTLQIVLPKNVKAGYYDATLKIAATSGCANDFTATISISIKMNPNDLMRQKWNDVIALHNKANNPYGYEYLAYQWYKNGQILLGKNGSYLYLTDDVLRSTDRYSVLLTLTDGTQFMTCDFVPDDRTAALSFPTFVNAGQMLVFNNVEQTYNVSIRAINGYIWSGQTLSPNNTTIAMPALQGMYILNLQTDNFNENYKILVK